MTDEIEKFIKEDIEKDINQEDKIDDSVKEHLSSMGFLWDRVNKKLNEDSVCFKCKTKVDFNNKEVKMQVLQASNSDPGTIAFVSICEKCMEDLKKEAEANKK